MPQPRRPSSQHCQAPCRPCIRAQTGPRQENAAVDQIGTVRGQCARSPNSFARAACWMITARWYMCAKASPGCACAPNAAGSPESRRQIAGFCSAVVRADGFDRMTESRVDRKRAAAPATVGFPPSRSMTLQERRVSGGVIRTSARSGIADGCGLVRRIGEREQSDRREEPFTDIHAPRSMGGPFAGAA